MEYPTLFTCGTQLNNKVWMQSPEGVTVHEAGHQFWYGLVGNNEFEAAWLDEGFNSYTDSEVLFRRYGLRHAATWYSGLPWKGVAPAPPPGGTVLGNALAGQVIPLPWVEWDLTPIRSSGFLDAWRDQPQLAFVQETTDPRWNDRVRYLGDPDRDPVDTFGWKYVDRASYSTNSYPRTAVALRSLPAIIGHEKFLRGMRHYSEAWRYRHPYPQDFFDAFMAGAGVDVSWYFDAVFRGTGTVDWSVSVEQERVKAEAGTFQAAPGEEFTLLEEESEGEEEDRPWKADVLVMRRGELRLPLVIELRFEDGTNERRSWSRVEQRESRWLRIEHEGEQKLVAVLLDPDRTYFLDTDLSNNRWYDERDLIAPLRWSERVFNRYLHLLHWQAGIGG
jgi:aminopeptidase N